MDNLTAPIICFGQQPNGFFPKGFFVDKILTAKKLQQKIGGRVVWFCHDSDHDYRETITKIQTDRYPEGFARFNINQPSKFGKLFTPLYLKRIKEGWQEETARKLEPIIPQEAWELFKSIKIIPHTLPLERGEMERGVGTVADFCLAMYRGMGLLDGIEVVRSSDPHFRSQAIDISGQDHYLDIEYKGVTVHARKSLTAPPLKKGSERRASSGRPGEEGGGGVAYFIDHGGDVHENIPAGSESLAQALLSPTRETRFPWMQSVVQCTHYIYGKGEKEYVDFSPWKDIEFIERDQTLDPEFAVTHFDPLPSNALK